MARMQSAIAESEGSTIRQLNHLAGLLSGNQSAQPAILTNKFSPPSPLRQPLSLAQETGSDEFMAALSPMEEGAVITECDKSDCTPTERASSDDDQFDKSFGASPSTYASFTEDDGSFGHPPDALPAIADRILNGGGKLDVDPPADDDRKTIVGVISTAVTYFTQAWSLWASFLGPHVAVGSVFTSLYNLTADHRIH